MRKRKKTIPKGLSVIKKARSNKRVKSKARAIKQLESRIKKLKRQKETIYKRVLKRLTKKRR